MQSSLSPQSRVTRRSCSRLPLGPEPESDSWAPWPGGQTRVAWTARAGWQGGGGGSSPAESGAGQALAAPLVAQRPTEALAASHPAGRVLGKPGPGRGPAPPRSAGLWAARAAGARDARAAPECGRVGGRRRQRRQRTRAAIRGGAPRWVPGHLPGSCALGCAADTPKPGVPTPLTTRADQVPEGHGTWGPPHDWLEI